MRIDDGNGELPIAGRFRGLGNDRLHDIGGAIGGDRISVRDIEWHLIGHRRRGGCRLLGLNLAADRHGRASRKNRQTIPTHVFLPRMLIMRVLIMLRPGRPLCAARLTLTVGVFRAG